MSMTNQGSAAPTEIIGRFTRAAPVDVDAMADALGLVVVYEPMDVGTSGQIRFDVWEDAYEIKVNNRHHPRRQRFTLAHEIAHYVLHRDQIGDGIIDDALYRSNRPHRMERQANSYAASLLMPAPLVRREFAQGANSEQSIARIFDVSVSVARIRLEELGLVPPPDMAPIPGEDDYGALPPAA